jgi:hypothetical protein
MAAGWPGSEWALDLHKSGDLLARLPQALRGRIVPGGGARLDLAAIIEIAAADMTSASCGELARWKMSNYSPLSS